MREGLVMVLHVWQYTVCPHCKHEGRYSFTLSKKQIQWRIEWACFLILQNDTDGTKLVTQRWDTNRKQRVSNMSLTLFTNTVLHSTLKSSQHKKVKDCRRDYTCAQEYKEEIQRVIEETRQHVSKWCLYPLRSFSMHFDNTVNDLLNFGCFPFLNPSVC